MNGGAKKEGGGGKMGRIVREKEKLMFVCVRMCKTSVFAVLCPRTRGNRNKSAALGHRARVITEGRARVAPQELPPSVRRRGGWRQVPGRAIARLWHLSSLLSLPALPAAAASGGGASSDAWRASVLPFHLHARQLQVGAHHACARVCRRERGFSF